MVSSTPRSGAVTFEAAGRGIRVETRLKKGENEIFASLTLEKPQLWWPAGQGPQHLYELRATWSDADGVATPFVKRLGLRTLELVTKKDRSPKGQPSESFCFKVNGRPIFLKGGDFIPCDAYVDRCTPGVTRHLLTSMVEANMNAVRSWGGGWYEPDSFYDLCDELGLLVWQDFKMACAIYPDSPELMREYEAEVRYQVRRLQSHACVALWCGDNENLSGIRHWWARLPESPRLKRVYARVMGLVGKTCRAEDPTRRFWISSPSNGSLVGEPDDPNRGDVHYWKVWHGGRPFSDYLTVKSRFTSEFGFQSFPEPATLDAVLPPGERNVSSHCVEHHQRSPEGIARIAGTLTRELPTAGSFESFCRLSQINQADAIRTAVEHWRRLKPWCMGALYWQINDNWPVASWSSIDYYGRWKALHHTVGRAFAPLLASILVQDGRLEVWASSDVPKSLTLKGSLSIRAWSGKKIGEHSLSLRLRPGESRRVASFPLETLLGGRAARDVCAFATLSGGGQEAENYQNLVPWKWAPLVQPRLSVRWVQGAKGLEISVRSRNVVPFFHATLEGFEGHFTGDGQVLKPGREVRMTWVPHRDRGAQTPRASHARRSLRWGSLWDLSAR